MLTTNELQNISTNVDADKCKIIYERLILIIIPITVNSAVTLETANVKNTINKRKGGTILEQ